MSLCKTLFPCFVLIQPKIHKIIPTESINTNKHIIMVLLLYAAGWAAWLECVFSRPYPLSYQLIMKKTNICQALCFCCCCFHFRHKPFV